MILPGIRCVSHPPPVLPSLIPAPSFISPPLSAKDTPNAGLPYDNCSVFLPPRSPSIYIPSPAQPDFMKYPLPALLIFLCIGLFVLASGCTGRDSQGVAPAPAPALSVLDKIPEKPEIVPAAAGTEQMVAFVKQAVAYAHAHGKAAALSEFSNRNGSFFRGALYIYAHDWNGTTIAHPVNPEKLGVSRLSEKDALGQSFIRLLRDTARNGSGFVRYTYINPLHGNAIEEKIGYVEAVDETWWLGSGIYAGPVGDRPVTTTSSPASSLASSSVTAPPPGLMVTNREELESFVTRAREFAKSVGRDAALTIFNEKNGPFTFGEVYIFAYDYNSTTLALPYQPEIVGTSRTNFTDQRGVRILDLHAGIAKNGGGFDQVVYANPAMNMTPRNKTCYVLDVDGDWYLGSGIYS